MNNLLFKNEQDINDSWISFIENEAQTLSLADDAIIRSYMDNKILNPLAEKSLEHLTLLKGDSISDLKPLQFEIDGIHSFNKINTNLKFNFKNLKEKIRKLFCKLATKPDNSETKILIKSILLALIPTFATGIPALVLPLIIGFVALFIKRGYSAVCPN